MRGGDLLQLLPVLGERHVENALTSRGPLEQEAQCERGLAGAGIALDQVKAARRKAAAENVVQPLGPRTDQIDLLASAHRVVHHGFD